MTVKSIVASLAVVTLFSCNHKFDEKELSILNTYNTGDTLVFQSNKGSYDSIVIINKQFRYNGFSEGYSGNPQTADIMYRTIPPDRPELVGFGGSQGDVYSNEKHLLSAVKWKKDMTAIIDLKYCGFTGKISSADKLIHDKEFGEHYDITHFCIDCTGVDSTDVVRIKWKPDMGIVWYQRKDSSIYKLLAKY